MRLIGWGALWGLSLFIAPFLAISASGILFNPSSIGYLLFALPVVAVAGVTVGALGGALAAAIAPLARKGPAARALTRCAVLYLLALAAAAAVLVLLFVPAEVRTSFAALVPVVAVIGTALATWGLDRDRRRHLRAGRVQAPTPAAR